MAANSDGMVALNITTDAAGDYTGTTEVVSGKTINAVRFVNVDLAATSDFTITENETGQTILTLTDQNGSTTKYPASSLQAAVGGSGLVGVYSRISIGHSAIKVVVAQGGDTKTGTIYFLLT